MTDGARIPKLNPSSLDDEQRSLYDAIAGGRRAQGPQLFRLVDADGCLEGPFNAFLLQPRLGSALQALGSAVRYDTGLDDRCREIAILVVAAQWQSAFEAGTPPGGRPRGRAGRCRTGRHPRRPPRCPGRTRGLVARTVAALVARGDLDDAEYREAVGRSARGGPVRAPHPRRLRPAHARRSVSSSACSASPHQTSPSAGPDAPAAGPDFPAAELDTSPHEA